MGFRETFLATATLVVLATIAHISTGCSAARPNEERTNLRNGKSIEGQFMLGGGSGDGGNHDNALSLAKEKEALSQNIEDMSTAESDDDMGEVSSTGARDKITQLVEDRKFEDAKYIAGDDVQLKQHLIKEAFDHTQYAIASIMLEDWEKTLGDNSELFVQEYTLKLIRANETEIRETYRKKDVIEKYTAAMNLHRLYREDMENTINNKKLFSWSSGNIWVYKSFGQTGIYMKDMKALKNKLILARTALSLKFNEKTIVEVPSGNAHEEPMKCIWKPDDLHFSGVFLNGNRKPLLTQVHCVEELMNDDISQETALEGCNASSGDIVQAKHLSTITNLIKDGDVDGARLIPKGNGQLQEHFERQLAAHEKKIEELTEKCTKEGIDKGKIEDAKNATYPLKELDKLLKEKVEEVVRVFITNGKYEDASNVLKNYMQRAGLAELVNKLVKDLIKEAFNKTQYAIASIMLEDWERTLWKKSELFVQEYTLKLIRANEKEIRETCGKKDVIEQYTAAMNLNQLYREDMEKTINNKTLFSWSSDINTRVYKYFGHLYMKDMKALKNKLIKMAEKIAEITKLVKQGNIADATRIAGKDDGLKKHLITELVKQGNIAAAKDIAGADYWLKKHLAKLVQDRVLRSGLGA